MASLRRPEIGRQAQRIGRNAERRVITELEEAGWGTESNAELDYAGKTDARATCPAGREISMQVSAKQKSSGTRRRLKKRSEELVHEIANYSCVEDSQVIVGGDGADEIIDVLAKTFIDAGDEFIVPLPSYMYYEYLLQQYGARPVYAKWDLNENKLDTNSIFSCISEKTKMIFLCSPNNPTQ